MRRVVVCTCIAAPSDLLQAAQEEQMRQDGGAICHSDVDIALAFGSNLLSQDSEGRGNHVDSGDCCVYGAEAGWIMGKSGARGRSSSRVSRRDDNVYWTLNHLALNEEGRRSKREDIIIKSSQQGR